MSKSKKSGIGESGKGGDGGQKGRELKKKHHHHSVIKNASIAINKRNDDHAEFLKGTAGLYCIKDPHGKRDVNCEVFLFKGEVPSVRLNEYGLGMPLYYLMSQDMTSYVDKIKHQDHYIECKWHEIFSAIRPFLDERAIIAQRKAYGEQQHEKLVASYALQKAKQVDEARAAQVAAILARTKIGRDAAMAISGSKRGEYNIGSDTAYVLVSLESDLKDSSQSVLRVIATHQKSPLHGKVIDGKTFLKMHLLAKSKLPNNPAIQQEVWEATDALHKFVHAFAAAYGIKAKVESKFPKNVLPFKKAA